MSSVIKGVGPDAEITTNARGGRQSDTPYRMDLIPPKGILEVAKILDHGAKKYGVDNWKRLEIAEILNHAIVHIYAHLAGDRQEGASGHLSHAACRLLMALELQIEMEEGIGISAEKDPGFPYQKFNPAPDGMGVSPEEEQSPYEDEYDLFADLFDEEEDEKEETQLHTVVRAILQGSPQPIPMYRVGQQIIDLTNPPLSFGYDQLLNAIKAVGGKVEYRAACKCQFHTYVWLEKKETPSPDAYDLPQVFEFALYFGDRDDS